MSNIHLEPTEGGEAVVVPTSKVTIGRGPFLQVVDKRVSRNHATLEINRDGKLVLTPIHSNPCFLTSGEDENLTLPKDKPKVLEQGDIFSLLPDKLHFKVVYVTHTSKKEPASLQDVSDTDEEANEVETNDKEIKVDEHSSPVKKEKKEPKEMAMPLEKPRVLPNWMKGASKRVDASPKKEVVKAARPTATSARPKPTSQARSAAKNSENEDISEEEVKPKKRKPPARPPPKKAKPRKKPGSSDEESVDEEFSDDEEKPSRQSARKTEGRRPPRASAKAAMYNAAAALSGDDLGESSDGADANGSDSDFVAEEDSGSDWGASHSRSSRPSPRKGQRRSQRGRGSSSEESEEEYTPRASKRRAATKRTRRKQDSEDEEDWSEEEVKKPKPTRRGRGKAASKRKADSEEEDSDSEKPVKRGARKKGRKKESSDEEGENGTKGKRQACWYGAKCYRKNPAHHKEFCHPGDSSYEEEDAEDDTQQKKSTKKKDLREKDKLSVLHGASDDDGEANTYDYDDSFIANSESLSQSVQSHVDQEEEEDGEEEEDEDIKSLMKEAKGFMKNKRMQKPSKLS